MNEVILQSTQLPDTLEDLTRFVLVGREKLTSVRAEIRAIDKLQLAEEVRNQKKSEAQMLSEALLDAEVKLGELLKKIPKTSGGDRRSEDFKNDTAVHFDPVEPKQKVVKELGFTPKQAQRFETLANNKDVVEQVKQEARENDDIPTRSRVIDLVQRRNKEQKQGQEREPQSMEEYGAYLEKCHKTSLQYHDALYKIKFLEVNDTTLKEFAELAVNDTGNGQTVADDYIEIIQEAVPKLLRIQKYLKEAKGNGKSNHYRT